MEEKDYHLPAQVIIYRASVCKSLSMLTVVHVTGAAMVVGGSSLNIEKR